MTKRQTMTQSLEDYLEAIYLLITEGKTAQVVDVARMLSVRMPSVVRALRELKRLELVVQEPYSSISLTEKGRRVAHQVFDRHRLLRSFLIKLGVSRRIADRDACLMEHILSAETLERIRTYTGAEKQ
jgi:DtxR family Mn-dependent transcriptional regulator